MRGESERLRRLVPSSEHLQSESRPLVSGYYLRHRVETIKRIWLTSQTDALALASMVDEDYESARVWSKYLTQELSHDLLYLRDLKKHGYSVEKVASMPVFRSTQAMVGYLKSGIASQGSIVAVAYSIWVEWNSDKASGAAVKRAAKAFGPDYVRGAKAHTQIDVNEDHYLSMLRVVARLLARGADELGFFQILRTLTEFFVEYFQELDASVEPRVRRGLVSAMV